MKYVLVIIGFLVAGSISSQSADSIIKTLEDKINVENLDLTNVFTLVQKKEGEADRVLKLKVFRRDYQSKFTIVFQFPDSEKGKGYFRAGDDLNLYLPSTREFVYRNRKDDVGSTDIRTDLFGKQDLLSQYTVKLLGKEVVAKNECYVIEATSKSLDVSFPVQKWYVKIADGLPMKVENFSNSKTLLRTVYYIEFKEVAKGKFIFTKLMSINNLEKNQRTLLQNDEITSTKIADYTFSKAYLEEQSR